ncbi:MAG: hypothetical protein KAR31_08060, partial [Candidatus Omnitrophica bacterium]|nr:hypothetical protein [Candidatus Omnitrophota bacterium]
LIDRRNNLKDWAGYELSLLYPSREDYISFKEIPAHCYATNGTMTIGFGPILMIAYRSHTCSIFNNFSIGVDYFIRAFMYRLKH